MIPPTNALPLKFPRMQVLTIRGNSYGQTFLVIITLTSKSTPFRQPTLMRVVLQLSTTITNAIPDEFFEDSTFYVIIGKAPGRNSDRDYLSSLLPCTSLHDRLYFLGPR